MIPEIQNQIESINNAIAWVKKNRPTEYENKFLELVEERRKLRLIGDAMENNPAIAAYGVSQVGKSFLVNCMLQKNGKPFLLEANGRKYKFIEEMNPIVNGTEATGVVTRFTSYKQDPKRYSDTYPILMRCLSVVDVIQIVSDGYYKDIHDFTSCSESELEKLAQKYYDKYKDLPSNTESPIQPDDVLTIKSYFHRFINNAQAFEHTSYFNTMSLIADKIPVNDWLEVFGVLWNNSSYQTKLFKKLTETLAKFKYAKYVYLSPDALLHNGINEDTIMSVQCLNQLFSENPAYFTDVYLRNGENFERLTHLTKSEVSAVCAEIVIRIGEEYLKNSDYYCLTGMSDDVKAKISQGKEINVLENTKIEVLRKNDIDVLENNDLLDFPGARSRLRKTLETLCSDDILVQVLLRGKVSFFFNTYNESKKINILLYCHAEEKNEVSEIPILLNNWIQNNVGDTMEKRRNTLELTSNISPLFYIATKFNKDMVEIDAAANSENALKGRWNARFTKVLYKECFNVDGSWDREKKPIFLNWTQPGEHFQNSYILRDFKYSGKLFSKLYEDEKGPDAKMTISENHYNLLRRTFVESEDVKIFFADPARSWDVCASINNDGALYILENLSKVAKVMNTARATLFKDIRTQCLKRVYTCIKDYLVPDDLADILLGNIRKAHGIFRELEFTCQTQPDYFGNLLKALQLTEAESYNRVHYLIPTLTNKVVGDEALGDYELVRKRCGGFDECKNEEEFWQKIIRSYRFADREEAEEYLKAKGVDATKLMERNRLQRKNSAILADDLMQLWKSNIQNVQFMNRYSGEGLMDEVVMTNLVSCLISTASHVGLRSFIEKEIADYVDVLGLININEDLVADIVATTISDFVMNFGFNFLSEEEVQKSRHLSKEQELPCFDWILKEHKEEYTEDEMTGLFNEILSSSCLYTPAYDAQYNRWLEYMYIAFIANVQYPEFDIDANNELKNILVKLAS